ncbi:L,D-transpeptidase [Pelagibacterium halotolerans]|uniref:L,D-transpeptidase n=1 Tax=Pelagibacterium halotolerans TaxID=531813 RepID=UPI0038506BCC
MIFARHATAVFVALFIALGLAGVGMAQGDRIWDQDEKRWIPRPEPIMGRGSPIRRETVDYETSYAPGTIIVDTSERRLYLILEDGKALKYGVGVGRDGFTWSGTHRITRKAEWPGWTPPPAMRRRQPDLPAYMEGGPMNPLGARALYIGSTLYRLHGTAEPWTIGQAVSSGCIRLTNDDIVDLYNRVEVGALVVVRH